jgi:hypothetical protein
MKTFSRLASDGITNLWVKLCNLLQCENYHDSHAHGHE